MCEDQKPELDRASARALTEAGYMPLKEYLELCKLNDWEFEEE